MKTCQIKLQTVQDDARLMIGEVNKHVPFPIRRFYTIDRCVSKLVRGQHAHKKTTQLIICLRGDFDLVLDDGEEKRTVHLTDSNQAVLIHPKVWHEMSELKEDTLILVLASSLYDESDYIRDYRTFLQFIGKQK